MIRTFQDAEDRVRNSYRDEAMRPWLDFGLHIIETLRTRPLEDLEIMDLSTFESSEPAGVDPTEWLRPRIAMLNFLSCIPGALLAVGLCLKEDGRRIILPRTKIYDAVFENDPIPHPETGEMIENPTSKVYMFWTLTEFARQEKMPLTTGPAASS